MKTEKKQIFKNRTYSMSTTFEEKTMLPFTELSNLEVILNDSIKRKLHTLRNKFFEQKVTFEKYDIRGEFLTTNKNSFEALIVKNKIVNYLPKLACGIRQPDEFYLNLEKKVAFIIEKKTQTGIGSADEKIQTAPFKKYVLSKKFKKG
jgi:hypothetical protein